MDDLHLTAAQQRVLDCIRFHLEHHGRAPTLREIAENLGLARHSSAQDHVEALVRKGALERLPNHRQHDDRRHEALVDPERVDGTPDQ